MRLPLLLCNQDNSVTWDEYRSLKDQALDAYNKGRLVFDLDNDESVASVSGKDKAKVRQIRAFYPDEFARLKDLVEKANKERPEALKPRQRVMPRLIDGFARIINVSITDASNTRKMTEPGMVPLALCARDRDKRKAQEERILSVFAVPPEELAVIETSAGKAWALDSVFVWNISESNPLWIRNGEGKRYEARVITDDGSHRAPIALLAVQQEPGTDMVVQQSQVRRTRSDKLILEQLRPEFPSLLVKAKQG